MPAPAEVQAATLHKFIAGWKEFTPESWMATWSEDCTQKMLPLSLGIPARSRTEVLGILPKLIGILKNYKVGNLRDNWSFAFFWSLFSA
jgi:hypothetical protein